MKIERIISGLLTACCTLAAASGLLALIGAWFGVLYKNEAAAIMFADLVLMFVSVLLLGAIKGVEEKRASNDKRLKRLREQSIKMADKKAA